MGIILSRPVFITIKPQGFWIPSAGLLRRLKFTLIQERQARKYWIKKHGGRRLKCFSSNGVRSSTGDRCDRCPYQDDCQLKLRLYFDIAETLYCLELPQTSYENYREYSLELLEAGQNVKNVRTLAKVLDRGYWGEVIFSCGTSDQGLINLP